MRLWRRFWGSFCSPFSKQDYFDLRTDLAAAQRDLQVIRVAYDNADGALGIAELENKKLKEELEVCRRNSERKSKGLAEIAERASVCRFDFVGSS